MKTASSNVKKQFAQVLRTYRLQNCLSLQQVADYLCRNNIQQICSKTLYAWESGQTLPNVYTFLELCRLYHIDDILTTFELYYIPSGSNPLSALSQHERQLLLAYRAQPELHYAVQRLLGM